MEVYRCLSLTLSYDGNQSSNHEIDLYDVAKALMGFQRSLALTTHLVLHNEIITQAPALKEAFILASPPIEGSWKIPAKVMVPVSMLYALNFVPSSSPVGHLVRSAYDYVVNETLGFHVDYDQSLGQQYEDLKQTDSKLPVLEQHRLDSLAEKCEIAIKEMHRPIKGRETALSANIKAWSFSEAIQVLGPELNVDTYNSIGLTDTDTRKHIIVGKISSYNSNTFKGRIYELEEKRPISFELLNDAKTQNAINLITNSLVVNARREVEEGSNGVIYCRAYKETSKTGTLKNLTIIEVSNREFPGHGAFEL